MSLESAFPHCNARRKEAFCLLLWSSLTYCKVIHSSYSICSGGTTISDCCRNNNPPIHVRGGPLPALRWQPLPLTLTSPLSSSKGALLLHNCSLLRVGMTPILAYNCSPLTFFCWHCIHTDKTNLACRLCTYLYRHWRICSHCISCLYCCY